MNQDEVESQLSAMFDGELPAAECELLSRRLDRDENLRARWSRYALIGAAMRCEPVATARSDFAARVSRAVDRAAGRELTAREAPGRRRHLIWQAALAATLVGAVAGLSVTMLRYVAGTVAGPTLALRADQRGGLGETALRARHLLAAAARVPATAAELLARQREAVAVLAGSGPGPRATTSDREPWSYVTPQPVAGPPTALRTELVDYIVAHSEYSSPLMRPDLLSALISGGEEGVDVPASATAVGAPAGAHASSAAPAGAP